MEIICKLKQGIWSEAESCGGMDAGHVMVYFPYFIERKPA